jgi:transposase
MGSTKPAFVNGIRTNRTGRRTYMDEFKQAVVRECSEPGVSLAAVAMAHRINANLVRRWVRHRRTPDTKSKEVATLLPVTIEANAAMTDDDIGKRAKSNAATIELEVYGARIRLRGGVDVASLRSVLDVLAQR